jgi:TetR/AcrR family transcriptional regulator, tetracycline repressor protein
LDAVQFSVVTRPRGERAGISRADVIGAALVVLRRDGLDAVSMRRVAVEVGVAANALYSHVPDKAALLDALMDAVLADVVVPRRGGWRPRLEALLLDSRRVLLEHPELVPLFLARQMIGPNALRLGELMLGYLHLGGVRGERAVRALQLLLIHTIGATAFEVPRREDPDPEGRRRRGQEAAGALDVGDFPLTSGLGDSMAEYPGEVVFRLGLQWLLDGLVSDLGRGA